VYDADWSQGLSGWPAAYGWKVLSGTYINDASDSSDRNHFVQAPYIPEQANLPNYAVEADIQLVREEACGTFGLIARTAYYAGRQASGGCVPGTGFVGIPGAGDLKTAPVSPDNAWHSYRLEVRDNNLRLYLDGALLIETSDNRYLSGGTVGLFAYRSQVVVRSFKITSLG